MFSLLLHKPLVSVKAVFCLKGLSYLSSARVLIALSAYLSGMKEAHVCMSAIVVHGCTAPHEVNYEYPMPQLSIKKNESKEHDLCRCESLHGFAV